MNLGYQLKAAALPIWLLALHATVAAIAFVLLVVLRGARERSMVALVALGNDHWFADCAAAQSANS